MSENITSDNSLRVPTEPAVLNDPLGNRGVAFTLAEREALGLTGRLPSCVLTLEEQAWRRAVSPAEEHPKLKSGRFRPLALPPREKVRAAVADSILLALACLISYWLTTRPDAPRGASRL